MVLNWWMADRYKEQNGIIADGAIRSGKTVCMSLSFVMWAMEQFDNANFALCGKTIGSLRRNVLMTLKLMLRGRGYLVEDHRADNLLTIKRSGKQNYFYLFGGKDERSQDLIQGITLAGAFFDEVALMPESFVNQATARCSVEGSKWWFNCNPSGPLHFFKQNWIDQRRQKHLIYLHFTMDDNLSLSEEIKNRYRGMYSGVFYKRYILGMWALAEGLIYPMYQEALAAPPDGPMDDYVLSIDYGTQNAFAAILWGKRGPVWYALREYYWSGREIGVQKTDDEYGSALDAFVADVWDGRKNQVPPRKIETIIDPSAASFIALLRKREWCRVRKAKNDVLDGIRNTAAAMKEGLIKINPNMEHTVKEIEGYAWDEKKGDDRPIKENDHACDAIRYFVETKHLMKRRNNANLSGFNRN